MRHKQTIRKFGRTPKHRRAMFRNLATNLVNNERITTTLEKAKEMRPLIEKLIHKAKQNNYQGNLFLNNTLFTKDAIKRVKTQLVPRYENQKAGFTRIKYLGLRSNDRAKACYIEFVKNPIELFEKNQQQLDRENRGLSTFWKWEHKILQQEQEYFQNQILNIQSQIEHEVEKVITPTSASGDQQSTAASNDFNDQIRKEIEAKFAKKREFLQQQLKRAAFEEKIHLKQEDYNRYDRLYDTYAGVGDTETYNVKSMQKV